MKPCCQMCGDWTPTKKGWGRCASARLGWFTNHNSILTKGYRCKHTNARQKNTRACGRFKRREPIGSMTRPEILNTAKKCVCGQREQDYGSPENNFERIAALWNAYLGAKTVDAVDVAMLLALLKVARIKTGRGTEDSFVDLAGYAACAGEIATRRETEMPDFVKENQCLICGDVIPEDLQVCPKCEAEIGKVE